MFSHTNPYLPENHHKFSMDVFFLSKCFLQSGDPTDGGRKGPLEMAGYKMGVFSTPEMKWMFI